MDATAALAEEVRRIQASGVLGEARMRRLFEYLAARSLAPQSPKEITIAIDVFGKGADFDVSQDAVVRVYMHKLRRTLESFYSTHDGDGITPLQIPRGEYRLTLSPRPPPAAPNMGQFVSAATPTIQGETRSPATLPSTTTATPIPGESPSSATLPSVAPVTPIQGEASSSAALPNAAPVTPLRGNAPSSGSLPIPAALAAAPSASELSTIAPSTISPSAIPSAIAPDFAPSPGTPTAAPLPLGHHRKRPAPLGITPLAGVLIAGAALAAVVLLFVLGFLRWRAPPTDLDQARANPAWSTLLNDDRPLMIVVGDYYLIGETDNSMEVKRLIREYSVNSKGDLDNYIAQHPEAADRYMDVGLRYLPTSTAFALRDVMPLLGTGRRHVTLNVMSDVTPATLKSTDIVYIGYLSGLGIMQQLVFAGSRLSIGESYDELLDTKTKHLYISQTASQNIGVPQSSGKESPYRDYGYFANFRGPGGNTIVVISGTRDEGVRQTAEAFTNPEKLKELSQQTDTRLPFEALLEVSALDGVNLSGKVLLESKR
jgi:hypothetical protein